MMLEWRYNEQERSITMLGDGGILNLQGSREVGILSLQIGNSSDANTIPNKVFG